MSVRIRVRRLLHRDRCCPACGSDLHPQSSHLCDVCGYDLIRRVRDSQIRRPLV
jgi:predicted amidophosphoribosyltransferase